MDMFAQKLTQYSVQCWSIDLQYKSRIVNVEEAFNVISNSRNNSGVEEIDNDLDSIGIRLNASHVVTVHSDY